MCFTLGISDGNAEFTLPEDAITQAFAFLGRRGSGKTYAATVMAEAFIDGGHQVVVIDPLGVWWGLRGGHPLKHPPIILGGEHGDVPLLADGARDVAQFLTSNRSSAILDLSHMESKAEERRFVTAFAESLSRMQHQDPHPVHIVMDEVDIFAPQKPLADGKLCLSAIENVVRRGRTGGIGVSMISQRAAVINKDILTQAEALVVFQVTGPQDQAAIYDWIKYRGTAEALERVMRSLPTLKKGEAWVYSPAWLDTLERVAINRRKTFDSSATPDSRRDVKPPKKLSDVDLTNLTAAMQRAVETRKKTDPALLRKRVVELERQLAAKHSGKPIVDDSVAKQLREQNAVLRARERALKSELDSVQARMSRIAKLAETNGSALPPLPVIPASKPLVHVAPPRRVERIERCDEDTERRIGRAERRILAALFQLGPSSKNRVALMAGYSVSGSFNNSLSMLRQARLITLGDPIQLTDAGVEIASDTEALPAGGRELFDWWIRHPRLGKAERAIMEAIRDGCHDKSSIAQRAGYSVSGSFNNSLSTLRTLGLITRGVDIQLAESLQE